MKNLKQHLDKLDNLPVKAGMHKQWTTTLSQLENMWDSNREYHGDAMLHKAHKVIAGNSGKTISEIAEKISLILPRNYYQTPHQFVMHYVDLVQKKDGLFHEKGWRPGDTFTLEELENHQTGNRWLSWKTVYLDINNVVHVRHQAKSRRRTPKATPKEKYERLVQRRKSRKEARILKEATAHNMLCFINNQDRYWAFQRLLTERDSALKSFDSWNGRESSYLPKRYCNMIADGYRIKADFYQSQLEKVYAGDVSPLDQLIKERDEKK